LHRILIGSDERISKGGEIVLGGHVIRQQELVDARKSALTTDDKKNEEGVENERETYEARLPIEIIELPAKQLAHHLHISSARLACKRAKIEARRRKSLDDQSQVKERKNGRRREKESEMSTPNHHGPNRVLVSAHAKRRIVI